VSTIGRRFVGWFISLGLALTGLVCCRFLIRATHNPSIVFRFPRAIPNTQRLRMGISPNVPVTNHNVVMHFVSLRNFIGGKLTTAPTPMYRHHVIRCETPTSLAEMNAFGVDGGVGIAGIANVFGYGGTSISNRYDEIDLVRIPVHNKVGSEIFNDQLRTFFRLKVVELTLHGLHLTPGNRTIDEGCSESEPSSPAKRILYAIIAFSVAGFVSFRMLVRGKDFFQVFILNFLLLMTAFFCGMYGTFLLIQFFP
jgi:hypothetical protein